MSDISSSLRNAQPAHLLTARGDNVVSARYRGLHFGGGIEPGEWQGMLAERAPMGDMCVALSIGE